jgi:DNA polymerase III delta subunit
VRDAAYKWKSQFISKYGDFNLLHIKELENLKEDFLATNLLSQGFLGEKKLVLVEFSNDDLSENLTLFFLKLLDKIPESNIVVFVYPNPDKRTKFFKELETKAEVKVFDVEDENKLFAIINTKYK